MLRRFILAFVAFPVLASAQAPEAKPAEAPERLVSVTVFGTDPCPRSRADEIVVCARQPESERFRIPKKLREDKERRTEQSWASRNQTLEYVSRAGTPNSCSPVGSGGQTGCHQMFLRMAREERARAAAEAAAIP